MTGTRGVSAKVEASVVPASASQDLLWESTDTDLVTVTRDGTIEAVKTYEKLEDINKLNISDTMIIQIGKKKFIKLCIK